MKKKWVVLKVLIFVIGLGIFAYPIISNFYTNNFQTRAINEYQKEINKQSAAELQEMQQEMMNYNQALVDGTSPQDPFAEAQQDGAGSGISASGQEDEDYSAVVENLESEYGNTIGVLRIPSIKVETPIFDGVSDKQLQLGVGVLPGTSLPVGGEDTHSVISGHRGLPTAKLFTDLPSVQIGDVFYVEVTGETHAYKVDQIKTIEPTEIGDLRIVPGEDMITLLTCTPYMINTHRLIVTAMRTEYQEEAQTLLAEGKEIPCCCWIILLLLVIILLLLFISIMLVAVFHRMGREIRQEKKAKKLAKKNSKKKKDEIEHAQEPEILPEPELPPEPPTPQP